MSLQEALARHGEVEILHADIPYYWSVFNEILEALEQKSPLVEGADLGCVYIGVDGLQLIYPDDNVLIDAMKEVVDDFAPLIGIAENKFLASLTARYSPPGGCKVLSGDIDSFLKDLSCDILPVSVKSRSKLHDGAPITAAGLVIRRQRPHGKVVFITLEDEFGHIPCMVFGKVYERYEHTFRSAFLIIKGNLTRREGTCNVVINQVKTFNDLDKVPQSKDWR